MSNVIQQKLIILRRKLSGWLFVHGFGRWLLAGLVIVGFSMLLDRVFKMDLAQRGIVLFAMFAGALAYFYWLVIRPLLQRANDDALLLQVERKHPELKENLISSWQLERQSSAGELRATGTSEALTLATIESGRTKAQKIDFGNALDSSRHQSDWTILFTGLLATTLLALGIWQTSFLKTWFRRNILLTNDSWPQATYLEIVGAKNGRLSIPRGSDHRQLVAVTEASRVKEAKVSLEIENPGGRSVQIMKPTGKSDGREHAAVLYNVSTTFRMRAVGGDDVTDWVEVDLVEPPHVMDLKLTASLPDYTGVKLLELTGNGPHTLLTGSRLQVEIQANKTLKSAFVKRAGQPDGDAKGLPMQALQDNRYAVTLDGAELAGGDYLVLLVDDSDLPNFRPTKFSLTLKEDQPPKVRASLPGISGLVVPQANIPTSYHAVDEFGLSSLFFDVRWTNAEAESESENKPVEKKIEFDQDKLFDTSTREIKYDAVLDLQPLNLVPGMSLRLAVGAQDFCPNPPGIGKSQEFLLRVVSNEELRADLLRREIEQRKAFEQVYEKQMELASELQTIAVRQRDPAMSPENFVAQREAALIALVRNQKGIGTGMAQVADRFEEFLVEIKNNRLDEAENELFPNQSIEARFDGRIIQPIRKLDQEMVSTISRQIDGCRTVISKDSDLLGAVEQIAPMHQQILEEMKRILSAMSDSENFQEVINDLLRIKDESRGLKKEIEKKSQPRDVFDDPNSDIFDK